MGTEIKDKRNAGKQMKIERMSKMGAKENK
jgi:hypothetical protein